MRPPLCDPRMDPQIPSLTPSLAFIDPLNELGPLNNPMRQARLVREILSRFLYEKVQYVVSLCCYDQNSGCGYLTLTLACV